MGIYFFIEKAKSAGITTVMITGDHKNTAFAIAEVLGIAENIDQAITGQELDALSQKEFSVKVSQYRVFARVSPQHKVKIVRGLRANGNVVSMTGDGVNDAPSLNAADIGVAMGITGTDSFPAIALGMYPGNPDVMREKPRDSKTGFFSRAAILRMAQGGVLIMSQLFYSLALRSSYKCIFTIGLFSNKYLVAALVIGFGLQLLVLNVTPLQQAFRLQPLAAKDWILIVGLGLIPLIVNEMAKIRIRHKMKHQ